MTKEKVSGIDSNHEIEEFLQEYIVEKVISGYKASTTEIKNGVDNIEEIIKSVKNSSNTTSQDISVLKNNDDTMLVDIDGIKNSINKMNNKIEAAIKSQTEIKGIIPNDDKIIEALSSKWTITISEKLEPMQSDMAKLITDVSELDEAIVKLSEEIRKLPNVDELLQNKYKLISDEISKLEELLNCQSESVSSILERIDQVNNQVVEKNNELLKNDSIIVQGIGELKQKMNWLWITVGVDTVLIIGLCVALLCRS